MDALKQQVDPAVTSGSPQTGNGWRNMALLLGFCLAVLLGFALSGWWQSTTVSQQGTPLAPTVQAEPALADSASIVAALVTAEPDGEAASAAAVLQPKQEQFKVEPKVVSVTVPQVEQASAQASEQMPSAASAEPAVEVSDELRQRFESAMAASETNSRQPQSALRGNTAPAKDISELSSVLQQRIPSLRFEAHVYATQSQQRWIKVNGKSLQEGQWVTADIRLKEITPQFVLLEMGNELFSMPALTDWPQN